MGSDDDIQAMPGRYARRSALADRYDPLLPEVLHAQQERLRATAALLARHAPRPLAELQLLEVGCGHGGKLLELLQMGFVPEHLIGNELLPERLASARARLPAALRLLPGDASTLALPTASLDLVLQATVFSSLLDPALRQRLALRLWQLLKPGGAVIWYDLRVDNPRNADVCGLPLAELERLFPQGRILARRVTLAPPLARAAAALHPALLPLLNGLPLLRSHLLAWIAKPP